MRVCFTGSRHFSNSEQVEAYLEELLTADRHLEVGHGAAKSGVDAMVAYWCSRHPQVKEWRYPVRSGPTGIDGNHRGAPLNRNIRMLKSFMPDKVVAFRAPGKSNGTDFTLREAEKLGIPTETHHES